MNNNTGYIYVYLSEIPQLCKIGVSKDFEQRIVSHNHSPYIGIVPSRNEQNEILSFCFRIDNYKRIEALLKKILNTIGKSEMYQISAKDAYALLHYLGGTLESNNTKIELDLDSIDTGTNIDELSYPKQMQYYAEELAKRGKLAELERFECVYTAQEYGESSNSRKAHSIKIGENYYIYTNFSANDSIRFIQRMIKLM